jgi:hypothetical protein
LVAAAATYAQGCGLTGPGAQLALEGNLDEAWAAYRKDLAATPDAPAPNCAAGIALHLMGGTGEAKKYFAMAISCAFDGDCANTIGYEQMVLEYFAGVNDFFRQGEIAGEAARVCLDAGKLDEAAKWYKTGRDLGLKEAAIPPERKTLWDFRLEHAEARIAARRGNREEAARHVAAAKALLDGIPALAAQQAPGHNPPAAFARPFARKKLG